MIKQCDGRDVGDAKQDERSSPAMKKRLSTCKLSHVAMHARPKASKVGFSATAVSVPTSRIMESDLLENPFQMSKGNRLPTTAFIGSNGVP